MKLVDVKLWLPTRLGDLNVPNTSVSKFQGHNFQGSFRDVITSHCELHSGD